jgi:hypothetical protein
VILTLGWKEMQEQATVWVAVAALGVLVGVVLALGAGDVRDPGLDPKALLVLAAAGLAISYGLVCGAMILAGEVEGGTLGFLDTLPVTRRRLWAGKLLAGLVLALLQGVALGGLGALLPVPGGQSLGPLWAPVFHGWTWLVVVPGVALEAYCWGLLGSALCRHALSAVLLAAVLLALPWVLATPPSDQHWGTSLLVRAGLAIGAVAGSALVFARPDLRRAAPADVGGGIPADAGGPSGARAQLWLEARQGGALLAVLAAAAFLLALVLAGFGPVFWPVLSLLAGVACGSAAYAAERSLGTYRFLGDQRLPLNRVWLAKTGFWLTAALVLAGLVLAGGLLHVASAAGPEGSRHGLDPGPWLPLQGRTGWRRIVSPAAALGLWLLYGFGFARTCSLVWRRSVSALFVALALSVGASSLWLPSLLAGGLPAWQVLVPALLLLLADRLVLRAWVSDRLYTVRPLAGLGLWGVLTLAWIGGCLAYRAVGVADLVEPSGGQALASALRAYEDRLGEASRSGAGPFLREAVTQLAMDEAAASPGGRGPRRGNAGPLSGPGPAGARSPAPDFTQQVHEVVQGGWSRPGQPLAARLDVLFAGRWAATLREATRMEPGVVEDPRRGDWFRYPDVFLQCQWAATLYTARALQLQDQGDDESALDHLVVVLALSRRLRHLGDSFSWTAGVSVERTALQGFGHWLERLGRNKELLNRALGELTRHEKALPPASGAVLGDYVLLRETLAQPVGLLSWYGCDGPSWPERLNGTLLVASCEAPWEKARADQLVRATFAGRLRAVEAGYPALAAQEQEAPADLIPAGRMALPDWMSAEGGPGGAAARARLAGLLGHSWLGGLLDHGPNVPLMQAFSLCRVRGLRLVLALALYRLDKGQVAGRLDDLVVGGRLRELPCDPFSPTGQPFGYRVSGGEDLLGDNAALRGEHRRRVAAGQGIVWSVGPDLTDDGGHVQGATPSVNRPRLPARGEDWIFVEPEVR